jgi:hypothetical protein
MFYCQLRKKSNDIVLMFVLLKDAKLACNSALFCARNGMLLIRTGIDAV